MNIADNGTLKNAFRGVNHNAPIVGGVCNLYTNYNDIKAGINNSAVQIYSGIGLLINVSSTNAYTLSIGGIAKTIAEIGGFLLRSEMDIQNTGEEVMLPIKGAIYQMALLGSGLETYLPCNGSDFLNVNVNAGVTWDFTTNTLKVTTTEAEMLKSIKVLSPAVDGRIIKDTAGVYSWETAKLIKVRL